MGKAILAVIVTLIVGYLGTVVGLELLGNWDEFGLLIAIAVMQGTKRVEKVTLVRGASNYADRNIK